MLMSRTDKDLPEWVWAKYYEPAHDVYCEHYQGWNSMFQPRVPCDLPESPKILHPSHRRYRVIHRSLRGDSGTSCVWEPSVEYYRYDRDNDWRSYWWTTPPKWYVDHVWNNVNRRRSRDECRKAIKEYRGSGEVDVIPNVDQARNQAKWGWS